MRRIRITALSVALSGCALGAAGCSSYAGSARPFAPASLEAEPGWISVRGVPLAQQIEESDCGAAAIAMVISYWTGAAPSRIAAELRPAPERGIRAGRLREIALGHGLAAFLVEGEVADLERELTAGRPVLVGLVKPHRRDRLSHYEVVVALHRERRVVVTLDPAEGWRQNSLDGFLAEWEPTRQLSLVVSPVRSATRMPFTRPGLLRNDHVESLCPRRRRERAVGGDERPAASFLLHGHQGGCELEGVRRAQRVDGQQSLSSFAYR
jgi:hypothetical protein